MKQPSEDMYLCAKCVTASEPAKWIRKNGRPGQCDFDLDHGKRGHVVSVAELASYVDEWFRDHYVLGEEVLFLDDSDRTASWQRGASLLDILSEELGTNDNSVTEAIIENLPDASDREISKGAETFYDDTALYESLEDVEKRRAAEYEEYWYENRFTLQWDDFCRKVQFENRFFCSKYILDNLFGDPSEYESGGELNPIYMLKAPQSVFRARLMAESLTEATLRGDPAQALSAPPPERTQAGRMNVEYIPAFYGAFSAETAVAELRPGIGEQIAIGEFALQRDVKVFDFTVFSRVPLESRTDIYSHTRYDFIQQMEAEISRRAVSHEKNRQYIPTQIVAEYIKTYFECDAVIYRSSVVNGRSLEHCNIVFLPQAEAFTGSDGSILKHLSFAVKEVEEVSYRLGAHPF